MEDRRDLDPAPPARRPATTAIAPPEAELGGPGTPGDPARRDTEARRHGLPLLVTRIRSCAGTATLSAAGPPGPYEARPAARPPAGTSGPWSSGWLRENPGWGYRRIYGGLTGIGVRVAAPTVWGILNKPGIDPAPRCSGPAWSLFLRSPAEAILACDLFTACLLDGTQVYVVAVTGHASRHIRILGVTLHPTGGLDRRAGPQPDHGPR